MQTLEQSLAAIMQEHGLDHLSLHMTASGRLYAVAHAGDICAHTPICDETTAAVAIKLAIENLNAKRYQSVEVPELPAIGEAA